MSFATECFSGECGLCKNCCQNTDESLQINIHKKMKMKEDQMIFLN